MLTVELDQAAEARLRADARSKGLSLEEYARQILENAPTLAPTIGQQILDELKREGILGAWHDRVESQDAQAYSRHLRLQTWDRSQDS